MKRWKLACLCLLLSACTPYIYGVPQPTWDTMSPQERQETMRNYEERQRALQRAAEERARQMALERQRRAEEERRARERIAAIHAGEGRYGDLLRVSLRGGEARIGDRVYRFRPFSFMIADGEAVQIPVVGWQGRTGVLTASYADRLLSIDGEGRGGAHFPFERRWDRGAFYSDTSADGPLPLRRVDLFVEVADRDGHAREPVMVLGEEEYRYEPPPPDYRDDHHRPEPPPVVTVPERPPQPPATPGGGDGRQRPDDGRQGGGQRDRGRDTGGRGQGGNDRRPPPVAERAPARVDLQFQPQVVMGAVRRPAAEPASFTLAEGESRNVVLISGNVRLPAVVSYRNGVVTVDAGHGPHPPQSRGVSVRLSFEKGWQRGKVYRVNAATGIGAMNVDLGIVSADRR